ncbi:hypothetical protein MD484_g9063, partial [Candolleomyces efflorescens]
MSDNDLHAVLLPNRDPRLPPVWRVPVHRQLEGIGLVKNIYIVTMKTDAASVKSMKQFEDGLKAPDRDRKEWIRSGLLEMTPGDYMFARDPHRSVDPEDDVFIVLVTGR